MEVPKLFPVLLAGGSGKRLWPLSRKSFPKQFSNIAGQNSLFQQAALRLISNKEMDFERHITLTNSEFRFIVTDQLQSVGIDPGPILIEPKVKNTASAILAASIYAQTLDQDAVLLVAPSDHVISDTQAFCASIKIAVDQAIKGNLVSFGIVPSRPETGYGYLELEKGADLASGAIRVKGFVEKPTVSIAEEMLSDGNYLWNSGIFLFRAADMIAAFETYQPKILRTTIIAVEKAQHDLGFLRLEDRAWSQLDDISIDYAIMEKTNNLVVVPFASQWSDLGDWEAVWSATKKDKFGNARAGEAHAIDCQNTLLRSENADQQLVGFGLKDIIAISMKDAVLVSSKGRSQDVKQVVKYLKDKNITQAEMSSKDYRPWGWFERLALGSHFQVKSICVNPHAALSLQSHKYRSEHWIVVEGTAKVTVNKDIRLLNEGESTYVPLGAMHRLENPGASRMVLIEVQIGTYLGEDDITRHIDQYNRTMTEIKK